MENNNKSGLEKVYRFAKKFGFSFNYSENFKSGTVNCFMIAPKTDIVFSYTEMDDDVIIVTDGGKFYGGVDRALNYYEELLILKGEFNGKF